MFFYLATMFSKISILLFYLRLSPYQYFRIAVYGLMFITTSSSVVCAFQFLFDCNPMTKVWEITITGGSCIEYGKLWTVTAVINSVTDILMILLPAWLMRHVRIPTRQKLAVTGVFMIGILHVPHFQAHGRRILTAASVFIASAIRLCYVATVRARDEADPTWDAVPRAMWA